MVAGQHGLHGVLVQDLVTAGRKTDEGRVQIHLHLEWEDIVLEIQTRCQFVTDTLVEVFYLSAEIWDNLQAWRRAPSLSET